MEYWNNGMLEGRWRFLIFEFRVSIGVSGQKQKGETRKQKNVMDDAVGLLEEGIFEF